MVSLRRRRQLHLLHLRRRRDEPFTLTSGPTSEIMVQVRYPGRGQPRRASRSLYRRRAVHRRSRPGRRRGGPARFPTGPSSTWCAPCVQQDVPVANGAPFCHPFSPRFARPRQHHNRLPPIHLLASHGYVVVTHRPHLRQHPDHLPRQPVVVFTTNEIIPGFPQDSPSWLPASGWNTWNRDNRFVLDQLTVCKTDWPGTPLRVDLGCGLALHRRRHGGGNVRPG